MSTRVIAVLIALALFGAALGAPEPLVQVASLTALAHHDTDDGSVADHRLDDVPAQAHAEGASDASALLMAPAAAVPPRPVMAPPRARPPAGHAAPWLDGLRRPPRFPPALA